MKIAQDMTSDKPSIIYLDIDSRIAFTEVRESHWDLTIEQVIELQSNDFSRIQAVFSEIDGAEATWVKPLPNDNS